LQQLLGGQLEGKQRQALNSGVSQQRFKSLIGDRPYELLTHTGGGNEGAVTSQPKEGERKQFKQGWGVYRNGQWVPE
jgi:hypothetical protein